MMRIQVKLFATLRQLAGWSQKTIELTEGSTLNKLLIQLTEQYPALNLTGRTLYAAVNLEFAKPEQVLTDGDEVALMPPVSGGCG
jgi:molybdopterin converting factor subunit 1